jgi:hypothetical protein
MASQTGPEDYRDNAWIHSLIEHARRTDNMALHDFAGQLRNHELAHRRHIQVSLMTATNRERRLTLDFPPIVTVVDTAPDEEAQLEPSWSDWQREVNTTP